MHDCDRAGQAVPGLDPREQHADPLTVKRRLTCIHGLTGDPKYNLKSAAQGIPYVYHVAAHFDANRATGRRLEVRACDLRFAKQ